MDIVLLKEVLMSLLQEGVDGDGKDAVFQGRFGFALLDVVCSELLCLLVLDVLD